MPRGWLQPEQRGIHPRALVLGKMQRLRKRVCGECLELAIHALLSAVDSEQG